MKNDKASRKIQASIHFIKDGLLLALLIIIFGFFGGYSAAYFWGLALLGLIGVYTAMRIFNKKPSVRFLSYKPLDFMALIGLVVLLLVIYVLLLI